jgi:hypothetical protein
MGSGTTLRSSPIALPIIAASALHRRGRVHSRGAGITRTSWSNCSAHTSHLHKILTPANLTSRAPGAITGPPVTCCSWTGLLPVARPGHLVPARAPHPVSHEFRERDARSGGGDRLRCILQGDSLHGILDSRDGLGGVAQCLEGAPDLRGIEHLCRSFEFLNSPINVLSWRRSRRTRSPRHAECPPAP